MAYVPDPKAKGLDVVVGGWTRPRRPRAPASRSSGSTPTGRARTCAAAGCPSPAASTLRGTVPAAKFRARLRRARVFVHGARWEDWGQAPLEALADGALLATRPAGGPYEGLRLARLLDPALVAAEVSGAALAPGDPRRVRAAATSAPPPTASARAELLRPYRSESVQETVTRELCRRCSRTSDVSRAMHG